MFNGNNLSHKVLLTAEQASKLGNVIKVISQVIKVV